MHNKEKVAKNKYINWSFFAMVVKLHSLCPGNGHKASTGAHAIHCLTCFMVLCTSRKKTLLGGNYNSFVSCPFLAMDSQGKSNERDMDISDGLNGISKGVFVEDVQVDEARPAEQQEQSSILQDNWDAKETTHS
ncbi:hypothetical protein GOP47_0029338 [Adiantum capillus-veneris]|nr:hypothetical protein GOP47_0029338 [Adiantum capillus-veneris]